MDSKEDFKQAIIKQLSGGKHTAITGEVLSIRLGGCDTRYMRECIKELRQEGRKIGMALTKPAGYFLIETVEELLECMRISKNYCIENAKTRRDLKIAGKVMLDELKAKEIADTGQLVMALE